MLTHSNFNRKMISLLPCGPWTSARREGSRRADIIYVKDNTQQTYSAFHIYSMTVTRRHTQNAIGIGRNKTQGSLEPGTRLNSTTWRAPQDALAGYLKTICFSSVGTLRCDRTPVGATYFSGICCRVSTSRRSVKLYWRLGKTEMSATKIYRE